MSESYEGGRMLYTRHNHHGEIRPNLASRIMLPLHYEKLSVPLRRHVDHWSSSCESSRTHIERGLTITSLA